MERSRRRERIDKLTKWWDEEVGERPADLESTVGCFLKQLPVSSVRTALLHAADDESWEDSEAVLVAARSIVGRWTRRNRRQPPMARVMAGRHDEEL